MKKQLGSWDEWDEMGHRLRILGVKKRKGLCPICGVRVELYGETNDGRLLGACRDAFTIEQWKHRG